MNTPNPVPSPPSSMPNRKVVIGAAAGALMTVVAWASNAFAGVVIPAEVALASSTVLVFVLQYLIPNAEV